MTNLQEITEIVIWFRELPYEYNELIQLLNARQRLAGFLFSYADEMQKQRKDWAKSKYLLEKGKNEKRVNFLAHGTVKADYMARANNTKEFEQEKLDEAIFWGMKEIYDAAMEVSQAMAQMIAHLREEWKVKNLQPS